MTKKQLTMEDMLGVLTPEQLKLIEDWNIHIDTLKSVYSVNNASRKLHVKSMLCTYAYFNLLSNISVNSYKELFRQNSIEIEKILQPYVDELKEKELQLAS